MSGRILGICRNRFTEGRNRPVVIEVVELGSQRGRAARPIRRWRAPAPEGRTSGRAAPRPSFAQRAQVHLTSCRLGRRCREAIGRLRRLYLTAYNCGRRLMSGQRSRTLDYPATHGSHAGARSRPPRGAPVLAEVHLLGRPQGHRHPVRDHRPSLSPVRLLADDAHAVSAGLSGPADSVHRQLVRGRQGAGRHHAARVLQPAGRDARDDHGVPRRRAAGRRRLRQLRHAAADWRARHGVPQAQHDELLGVLPGRRRHAGELLRARRRGAVGLDLVSAAFGHRAGRPDRLADRHDLSDHVVAARLDQLHRDDRAAAREGPQLHAAAVLRLGAVRDVVPAAAGVPAARSGRRAAVDGSARRDELLPAERARRQQSGPDRHDRRGRRRRRARAAATRCCGSICSGSSRIPRSTCSSCPRWASSRRSSPTTRGSRCGAIARWCTR